LIVIKINKKKYKGVYRWEEMTLRRFADLASIAIPEKYAQFIKADGQFEDTDKYLQAVEQITDNDKDVIFPQYYRKVVSCLSDIPEDLLNDSQVTTIYEQYFKPFVLSLIYHVPVIHFFGQVKEYTPSSVKSFRIGLSRYYLPETVNILGQDVPLSKEPILTYTEASDIFRGVRMSEGDVKNLALFMAIYCRKKGEEYTQQKALERQEKFMDIPMSVVWGVFFCTCRRLRDYNQTIRLFGSLPKPMHEIIEAVKTYRNTVAGALSTNVPVTEVLER